MGIDAFAPSFCRDHREKTSLRAPIRSPLRPSPCSSRSHTRTTFSSPRSGSASRATSGTRCMFSEDELQEVFRLAEEERRESVDLHFTQLLRENLLREQRLRLIEAIWGVVYSDGSLSEVEGHLARRIAELLGFQH